jgi:hypothetical protein
VFITDQILTSFDPFGTKSKRDVERVLISLTSSLMVATEVLDILFTKKKSLQMEVKCSAQKKGNKNGGENHESRQHDIKYWKDEHKDKVHYIYVHGLRDTSPVAGEERGKNTYYPSQ